MFHPGGPLSHYWPEKLNTESFLKTKQKDEKETEKSKTFACQCALTVYLAIRHKRCLGVVASLGMWSIEVILPNLEQAQVN